MLRGSSAHSIKDRPSLIQDSNDMNSSAKRFMTAVILYDMLRHDALLFNQKKWTNLID